MDTSIIILNYNNPRIIDVCLNTLKQTEGDYEVIVVDNGSSDPDVPPMLNGHKDAGNIDKLLYNPVNEYFAGGNNRGVSLADPSSKYFLLLNSDVAFRRPDWLQKQIAWMEGTAEHWPSLWNLYPTIPDPGPYDVISIGWSYDPECKPSKARPEGWCLMIRREWWTDISMDFPWHYGLEERLAQNAHRGMRIGLLSQYSDYMIHAEGQSGKNTNSYIHSKRTPDLPGWFSGLRIHTLDFTLGPNEHQSYLGW